VQLGLASEPELTEKWDTKIVDDPVVQSNLYSYISFATSGANSRTSQIFINIADNPGLDGSGFSPFGRVVSGMKVVEQLYNPAPRSSSGLDQTTIREQGNVWILDNYPETDIIALTEFNEGTSAAFAGRAAWMAPVAVVSLAVVWF
jgi:peptidyl-prolyl cis-trans isomerase A (cyclophilin A)